ncbi:hypothetical protein [Dokdonella koreensis]|uniref:hypothetical protein n=1 Tax=Dokdonella koreensis TaxID=323415 RepID=UPI0012372B41|nr:hypothetical protein [Dokdonella koreensis]
MFKFVVFAMMVTAMGSAFAASPQRVAFTSIGKARVGMSEQALVRALGAPLTHVAPEAEEEGCYYAAGRGLPEGVILMMLNESLARIDVYEIGVTTISGAGVGTSESELKRLYGSKLVQESHAYTGPEGHYLTLRSPDGRYGIRFETDGRLVTKFYAGTEESIRYIEGCL